MEAVGIVETYGLVAAIEGFDTMMKAANVRLLGKAYVGNGMQSMAIIGDIGAVQSAVEAAEAAIKAMGDGLFLAKQVIPRPSEAVADMIFPLDRYQDKEEETKEDIKEEEQDLPDPEELEEEAMDVTKEYFDAFGAEHGLQALMQALKDLTVAKLRKLAREYHDLKIEGRKISRADKKQLLAELETHYRETLQ